MKFITWIADLIMRTSVFTACCALGLCIATERLVLNRLTTPGSRLHLLVFGSTLIVYNLPRMLPRPYGEQRPAQPFRPWYFIFFFVGIVLLALGLPALSAEVAAVAGLSGMFAFAYFLPSLPFAGKKRLRDHGIVKIIVLTAVWTSATAILPILNLGASLQHYPYEILLRFIFVFALCVLFDIRDMATDISRNIETIPNKIGMAKAYTLVNISLVVFVVLSIVQYFHYPHHERLLAAILTAIITYGVARYVRRHPGHSAFVAMTDGMMLVYAILVMI